MKREPEDKNETGRDDSEKEFFAFERESKQRMTLGRAPAPVMPRLVEILALLVAAMAVWKI